MSKSKNQWKQIVERKGKNPEVYKYLVDVNGGMAFELAKTKSSAV